MGVVIMNTKSTVEIITEWDIIAARQLGRNEAKAIGFSAVDQAEITTAISELARNIYLKACAGEVTIEHIHEGEKVGIRITAADKSPGINDLKNVLEDGHSTSVPSAGLSSVKETMDKVDIQSSAENGTVVIAEKWV